MPGKRPLEILDTPESSTPPRGPKRRQLTGSLPPSSPFPSSSSIFATPRTPYTWIVPSDSPTNPFGRIRHLTQSTTLPRPTSFSKHLPLRFQVVREGGATTNGRDIHRDGMYRVVQVPLSYSIAHLRRVLFYVFAPLAENEGIGPESRRRSLRRTSARVPIIVPTARQKGQEPSKRDSGHLFEVQKDITMSGGGYKSGEIRSGRTWAKLSSVRDPYHYPNNDSHSSGDDLEEENDWRWEAEADFTLTHVWPKGGDLARGIVYHHDASTQIHITVNTKKIPGRKGVGNKPFVFHAYGSLNLDLPDAPLHLGDVDVTRFNAFGAFEEYLKARKDVDEMRNSDGADLDDEDDDLDIDPDMSCATLPMYSSSPNPFIPITPFPTERLHGLRVERTSNRILKLTKKGMQDAGLDDDDEDDEDVQEKDELIDDEVLLEGDEASERPEDWDPFRDEAELCR